LKANVEMTKLITEANYNNNPNWFREHAPQILEQLKEVDLAQPNPVEDKPRAQESPSVSPTRQAIRFGAACFAIALTLLGLQLINHYFEGVVTAKYATYSDWIASVLIAGFFGGLMVGSLILVFPYDLLAKVRRIKRGKALFGL
jgi:hypothetical protein